MNRLGTRTDPSRFVLELARRQLRDYRSGDPGTYFGEGGPDLSLDDAYAIQEEVARLRIAEGDAIAGFKLGCVGPKIFEQMGMSGPIRAFLYASEVRTPGASVAARPRARLAIEGEIAARLGLDGEIAEIFPVIELHHFVFRRPRKTLYELVANNGLNVGIVAPHRGDRSGGPSPTTLSVEVNGVEIDRGSPWGMDGGAEAAVSWLRTQLGARRMFLAPEDIILTGTPLGLHPVAPGDHLRVSCDTLGSVEAYVIEESELERGDSLKRNTVG